MGVLWRVVNPFPPGGTCLALCRWISNSPFPSTTPRRSPPSLLALCTRFVVASSPTSRFIAAVFVVHRGRFATLSPAVASPVRAPWTLQQWATVGCSSPSVRMEVDILSGPLVAACVSPPLILSNRRMIRSGGGDIHRSSPQPSFSCGGVYARATASPWVRVGGEGVHDCMVVSNKQDFDAWL
jgi:hypothetical protein